MIDVMTLERSFLEDVQGKKRKSWQHIYTL